MVEGWQTRTGKTLLEQIHLLRPCVSGFLITFIEREGRLSGTNLNLVSTIVQAAGDCDVTIAGGVTRAAEIQILDAMGADAQVGMALYSGKLSLAQGIAACIRGDGLWPTVVADEQGVALGLAWSNLESLSEAVRLRQGVYYSRKRGLWVKGASSGNVQELLRISLDCDRDTLRFTVKQRGAGFCHKLSWSCWGEGDGLGTLYRRLHQRTMEAPAGSYTKRLLEDQALLAAKLSEEAIELAEARGHNRVIEEAGDLLYFILVSMVKAGVSVAEVTCELSRRLLKVSRRAGDAK